MGREGQRKREKIRERMTPQERKRNTKQVRTDDKTSEEKKRQDQSRKFREGNK